MFNYNCNQCTSNQGSRPDVRNAGYGNPEEFETLQNARRDLIGEIDAIIQYDGHLHSTDNLIAKQTWENIRNEELVHVGELIGLLYWLAPYQKEFVERGLNEFNERLSRR